MIIATLYGGPHDGREVMVPELGPRVFPLPGRMWVPRLGTWLGLDGLSGDTVTYVPKRETLQVCPCCPGWKHKDIPQPESDLASITYQQHQVVLYYPIGFRT